MGVNGKVVSYIGGDALKIFQSPSPIGLNGVTSGYMKNEWGYTRLLRLLDFLELESR